MLKTGRDNVAPEEVEKCIEDHDDVAECIVVGVPDERLDEVGHALVICHEGATATTEDLLQWCGARLARFKVPARIVIVDDVIVDDLPRTGSGKLDRPKIEQEASQKWVQGRAA
jgi:acyl-CoA synthetase (AMP-forming)/AMP-acid ligase II